MASQDGKARFDPLKLDAQQDISNLTLIRRLLGLVWQYRRRAILVVIMHAVNQVILVGILATIGLGIDFIKWKLDPGEESSPQWPFGLRPPADWPAMQTLAVIGGSVIGVALLWTAVQYTSDTLKARLVQQLIVDLRSRVYDKMQRLSFRFFDANETGSIIQRVTSDVMAVRQFMSMVVLQVLDLVLALAIYLTYMVTLNVWLTLACLATTPVLAIASILFGKFVRPAYKEYRNLLDKAILIVSENVQGVNVVKGFSRQPQEIDKFNAASDAVRDKRQWIFWRSSIFMPGVHLLTQVNQIVLLVFGGYLVISGALPLGTGLIVFSGLLSAFSNRVAMIAQITDSIQQSLSGAQRMFEVLDAPTEIESPREPVPMPQSRGAVRFESVFFGYRPEEPVLMDINLSVEPGQCVAVVGATGSGKSTMLSLIPRFYDPQFGRLLIDGTDVRKLELEDLRRQIGLVFQESFLFSNTIAANIAFGHPEATPEQIEKAARIAAAHEFIEELPDGYNTIVGERALDLSGGQRQRLAIARAILLEPAILLLDDATAAIDPETEHEILQAMDNAMKGRTTFVVAHRLSTLRRADFVVVLEKGRVVQVGTHEYLMTTQGPYRKAARLQVADAESKRLLDVGDQGR